MLTINYKFLYFYPESTSTEVDTQSETLANSRKNSRVKPPREHRKSKAHVKRSPSIVVTKCESVEVEIHDTGNKNESRKHSQSSAGTSSSKGESRRSSKVADSEQSQSKAEIKNSKSELKPNEVRRNSSTIDEADPIIHESEYLTAPTTKSRSGSLNSEERCDSMYNRSGRSPSLRSVATTTEIRDEVTQTTPIEGFKDGRKTGADSLKPVMRYEPARSSFKKMQARRSGGREHGWLPKEVWKI